MHTDAAEPASSPSVVPRHVGQTVSSPSRTAALQLFLDTRFRYGTKALGNQRQTGSWPGQDRRRLLGLVLLSRSRLVHAQSLSRRATLPGRRRRGAKPITRPNGGTALVFPAHRVTASPRHLCSPARAQQGSCHGQFEWQFCSPSLSPSSNR